MPMSQDQSRPIMDDPLVPPVEMLFDGTSTIEEFKTHGKGFVDYFLIGKGGLKRSDRVLDVGSGNGQKARVLTGYLNSDGSYDGLEIVKYGIDWCTEKYKPYSNFRFTRADIYSSYYNPAGSSLAAEFEFPYPGESFDFIFLSSIFTHMLPKEMRHYLDEIARVLRPGGTTVITYFLLNRHSRDYLAQKAGQPGGFDAARELNLPHQYDSELCRVWDPELPEKAVAHDEDRVMNFFGEAGFEIVEVVYGNWCRRDHPSMQDAIVARKSTRRPPAPPPVGS